MPAVIQANAWKGLTSMNHLGAIYGNKNGNKNRQKMRRPERIPIVLANMQWKTFLEFLVGSEATPEFMEEFIQSLPEIEESWLENPDLRLGQMLINRGLFESNLGWDLEEDEYMVESGMLEARDIMFWGVNYNKDMSPKDNTEYKLIKDLETSHIEAILGNNEQGRKWVKDDSPYEGYFENELEYRAELDIHDD